MCKQKFLLMPQHFEIHNQMNIVIFQNIVPLFYHRQLISIHHVTKRWRLKRTILGSSLRVSISSEMHLHSADKSQIERNSCVEFLYKLQPIFSIVRYLLSIWQKLKVCTANAFAKIAFFSFTMDWFIMRTWGIF